MSGYPTFTNIPRVDGLSTDHRVLGRHTINEEYGMINYPHAEQIPFHLPYQMQQGFQKSMWVNPKFPIHGEVVGRS